MNLRFAALLSFSIICLFASQSIAQENPKPTPTSSPTQRSIREIVMMPVVYRVAAMDKVKVKSDLKYTDVDNPNLLMDIYSPPNLAKGEKLPAVIFIHGAAGAEYKPKNWGFYISWGRLIGASGFIGVNFTHRLSGQKTSLEDSAGDVAAAVNYIRTNADSLNINKDRVCLAAYSGGGVLLTPAIRDKPNYVRCLVSFYAYMDISQNGNLFAATESAETLRKFSPINYLANGSDKFAPMFIARAGLDQIPTMNDSIDRFIREALAKNVALTFANHPNGVHGFDSQTDDERSREILQSAIAFMKLHLGMTKVAK
ncbi:MAG: alpha/beta hydrolase [Acidobacteria bacterium]|nr:alpha/beta hydrolase [Acidobacteriota bacterium]MCA1637384.1 alpha/beta hydrolase [Acidobacteriota bacterium]